MRKKSKLKKKSCSIKKKKHPTKPINEGNLSYLGKFTNHTNVIERQNKKKQTIKLNSQPSRY